MALLDAVRGDETVAFVHAKLPPRTNGPYKCLNMAKPLVSNAQTADWAERMVKRNTWDLLKSEDQCWALSAIQCPNTARPLDIGDKYVYNFLSNAGQDK